MNGRYPPINSMCPHMLHGGDYNPEQWIRSPEIWDEDMRLMKLAGCNAVSTGIFSWTALEPEEGTYTFDWLDTIMDKLAANGIYCVLATPSASRPAWLSAKYPDVCRVSADGRRQAHAYRGNHCRSSPIYREKCVSINTRLAMRYQDHPALLVWHVSNEFSGGECHCDRCLAAFRAWLRGKFHDDLDALNAQWYTQVWNHTYTDWDQIRPVDATIHGLVLDWKRFLTVQTIDFFKAEIAPLRKHTPGIPVTTNFMGLYPDLDYWSFSREVDVISWDSYPAWHDTRDDVGVAVQTGFVHDIHRAMKGGKPWMLMESAPSFPTRDHVCKRKRPGMHRLSSLQAVAHGADTVQYFQWRMSRGGWEKFHGAVVDHVGSEHTRVFRDVSDVGAALRKLDDVVGTTVRPEVAVMYDWNCRWAIDSSRSVGEVKKYEQTCMSHYRPFWEAGIPVDVIDETCDIAPYKLVVAPMLHLLRDGMEDKLAAFVREGGTVVMTYWSGIVNENDLCYLGGWPGGGLRGVFGIWDEEIDALQSFDRNTIEIVPGNALGLSGCYEASELCSVIHAEGAHVLATYGSDFYAGMPALTVHPYGKGHAYYMAARADGRFLKDFYTALTEEIGLERILASDVPDGVSVQLRRDARTDYVFLMNFTTDTRTVDLGTRDYDLLTGAEIGPIVELSSYQVSVLRRNRCRD